MVKIPPSKKQIAKPTGSTPKPTKNTHTSKEKSTFENILTDKSAGANQQQVFSKPDLSTKERVKSSKREKTQHTHIKETTRPSTNEAILYRSSKKQIEKEKNKKKLEGENKNIASQRATKSPKNDKRQKMDKQKTRKLGDNSEIIATKKEYTKPFEKKDSDLEISTNSTKKTTEEKEEKVTNFVISDDLRISPNYIQNVELKEKVGELKRSDTITKVVKEIVNKIETIEAANWKKVNIETDLGKLGTAKVELRQEEGKLNVLFNTTSEVGASIIDQRKGELEVALRNKGYEVNKIEVSTRKIEFQEQQQSRERRAQPIWIEDEDN